MSVIYVLIPLAVIIVAIAIGVFFWAVKTNQFEDLERQGHSILFDDDIKKPEVKNKDPIADKQNDSVNTSEHDESAVRTNKQK